MKTIFINIENANSLNYDFDSETSWKSSLRLSKLKKENPKEKVRICLYNIPQAGLSFEQYLSLNRANDWAEFYTSDFSMDKKGFFPLLLDEHKLFFTDIDNFTFFNNEWALDNIYKTDIDFSPSFSVFNLVSHDSKEIEKIVIEAQSTRVKDIFGTIKAKDSNKIIQHFCKDNQGAKLEITYTDKYVKTELSLILCLAFIQRIIKDLQTENYEVTFNGLVFHSPRANNENHRRLTHEFMNDNIRDEIGSKLINNDKYHFISGQNLPHYRELSIKAFREDTIETLSILPDAGLAFWGLDISKCQAEHKFYNSGNGIQDEVPVLSTSNQYYYIHRSKQN